MWPIRQAELHCGTSVELDCNLFFLGMCGQSDREPRDDAEIVCLRREERPADALRQRQRRHQRGAPLQRRHHGGVALPQGPHRRHRSDPRRTRLHGLDRQECDFFFGFIRFFYIQFRRKSLKSRIEKQSLWIFSLVFCAQKMVPVALEEKCSRLKVLDLFPCQSSPLLIWRI